MIKINNQTVTTKGLLEIYIHLYMLESKKLEAFLNLLPQLQDSVIIKIIEEVNINNGESRDKFSQNILLNWELIEYFIKKGISLKMTGTDLRQSLFTVLSNTLNLEKFTREIISLKHFERMGIKRVHHYSDETLKDVEDTIYTSDDHSKLLYTNGSFFTLSSPWHDGNGMTSQQVRIIDADWIVEVDNVRHNGELIDSKSSIVVSDLSRIVARKLPLREDIESMYYRSKKWKPKKMI